jgi:hypothetical protein
LRSFISQTYTGIVVALRRVTACNASAASTP